MHRTFLPVHLQAASDGPTRGETGKRRYVQGQSSIIVMGQRQSSGMKASDPIVASIFSVPAHFVPSS